jgi:hypothetical protein
VSELLRPGLLAVVHPELAGFARLIAAESPHDWMVVSGERTLEGVLLKYAEGRTRPGPYAGRPGYPPLGLTTTQVRTLEGAPHARRVTPAGLYACAVDMQYLVAPGRLASGSTQAEQAVYRWYGERAEGLGLVWGGRFPKVDQAHVQLKDWRDFPLPGGPPPLPVS